MPKQRTKHTHTVQKEYLKNFASEENGKFLLWRLDKTTGEILRLPIDTISVENYFYPQEIEDWLANKIERQGISGIKKIITNRSVSNLSLEAKEDLTKWIIVQDLRTREFRNEIKQGFEEVAERIIKIRFLPKNFPEVNPNRLKVVAGEDPIKNIQMSMIKRFQTYAPIIRDYHWSIIENNTGTFFYTSDHPVMRDNSYLNSMKKIMKNNPLGSGTGYFSKGVEFHLPLNPELKLVLRNLEPLDDMLRDVRDAIKKKPFLYSLSGPFFNLYNQLKKDKHQAIYENVLYYNGMITGSSNRFILSKDNNFKIAVDFLRRNPEMKSTDRKRWKIS